MAGFDFSTASSSSHVEDIEARILSAAGYCRLSGHTAGELDASREELLRVRTQRACRPAYSSGNSACRIYVRQRPVLVTTNRNA